MTFALQVGKGHHPLHLKLDGLLDLSDGERRALLDLPASSRNYGADADIVRDGERPTHCGVVLEGFVCRYKILADGRRQIMGLYVPGDMPDLQSLHVAAMDHGIATLTPSRIAFLPHQNLRLLLRQHPAIADALWRETLVDAAVLREWLIGIGRRTAYQRLAHLLCELHLRLKAIGLANDGGYELPITQSEFGDALGLSTVHVNRVLQDLRSEGLILLQGGTLRILDWDALQNAGDFDPTYLQLKGA